MSKEYVRCTGGARADLLAPGGITATVSKGGARHGGSENRLKTKIAALLGGPCPETYQHNFIVPHDASASSANARVALLV